MVVTYAANLPGDVSIVFPLGVVNLPPAPPFGAFAEVGPDAIIFPFTAPKLYVGPHLFIEVVNNQPPAATVQYWVDSLDNNSTRRPAGHNTLRGEFGCGVGTLPTALRMQNNLSNNALGTTTGYTLSAATASTPFLFTIGFQLDRPYGLPAPFDLAPIGASGCPFWNSLEVITIGSTTASGMGMMLVAWPTDPSIAGVEVGLQALVISPGYNAAGLTTSNGVGAWIGGRYPLVSSAVWGSSLTAATGGLFLNGTQITHLFWL
jgi:hypothetical protein